MDYLDLKAHLPKLRSLPNSKNIHRYMESFFNWMLSFVIYNFVYICFVAEDLTPQFPVAFFVVLPFMFVHIYAELEAEYRQVNRETMKEVVIYIRLKQNQSLKEKLEEHPEILKQRLDNKSLLYYAKKYKNLSAHSLIISQERKHSRVRCH